MNKFEAHINPSKTLKLKRANGEEDVFTIQPLPYKFMPKIFKLMNRIKDLEGVNEKDTEKFFKVFDEETVGVAQILAFESLKASYPDEDVKVLEGFASTNIFNLIPVVLEVNSFSTSTDSVELKKKMDSMKKLQNATS